MDKKTCGNCGQMIGNLEESFYHNNQIVCKACKILLEEETQALGIIESNKETEIPIAEVRLQENIDNKYEVSKQTETNFIQKGKQKRSYGGIRRTGYFFGMIGVLVANGIFNAAAQESEPAIASLVMIVLVVFSFFLVVNRLHNIGMSGWWSLLILIPFANLYVGIKCLICPEGYQDTKKLDNAGKIIAGIFIGLVILIVVGAVIGSLSS